LRVKLKDTTNARRYGPSQHDNNRTCSTGSTEMSAQTIIQRNKCKIGSCNEKLERENSKARPNNPIVISVGNDSQCWKT